MRVLCLELGRGVFLCDIYPLLIGNKKTAIRLYEKNSRRSFPILLLFALNALTPGDVLFSSLCSHVCAKVGELSVGDFVGAVGSANCDVCIDEVVLLFDFGYLFFEVYVSCHCGFLRFPFGIHILTLNGDNSQSFCEITYTKMRG